jgi:hypothetical protein
MSVRSTIPAHGTPVGAIIAALSFFLGAVFRPYFTGYATKKGENLATHDDIDKLVDQVKAVTEATKKIEAEISSGVWDNRSYSPALESRAG